MEGITARFDDLRGTRGSLELHGLEQVLTAHTYRQVPEVLSQAEGAAEAGMWAAGFVAFEAAPAFDPVLSVHDPSPGLPLAWFALFRSADPTDLPQGGTYQMSPWTPDVDVDTYRSHLETISQRILAGDTYQTNYTIRLRGQVSGDLRRFYTDLADSQRGSHHALLTTDRHALISASPEMFFRWDGRRIETQPMKGTIPRGRWESEDRSNREQLLASGKDRAENVMIVDLVRNDLGRVARFGTVKVEELFGIERLVTVWQMTSVVAGETRAGTRLGDIFAAMFPCGSVTGAPKPATMQLIRRLETSPRGVYCGAIGLLAPPGSGRPKAEFSVAIRTVTIDLSDRSAEYGVGGGIVYDSTPFGEYAEAMAKTRVLTDRGHPVTLLETMRWDPGTGFWLAQRHLNRLRSSARFFGFVLPEAQIIQLLSGFEADAPRRVRLLVTEEGQVCLEDAPIDLWPATVGVSIDDQPIDRTDRFRYHKTTRRSGYEQAAQRHPYADEVILVNERHEVVETTTANLAVRLEDEWLTPPLDAGCLPGTYREELIDHGALREHPLFVADLIDADELAVINSVRGWCPAKLVYS